MSLSSIAPNISDIIDSIESNYSYSIRRGIAHAIKLAYLSECPTYRVGAVLIRNGNIIGSGFNWYKKTTPDSKTRHNGIHAEFHCVRLYCKKLEYRWRLDIDQTSNAMLFVARITPTGDIGIARPCDCCQDFLKFLNLKRIYYTDRDGSISSMIL